MVGSRASDKVVASRSASDQPKKCAARRFVVRSKLEGRSWLVVRRNCAAADMHPCLLFERVSQQIDVLQESARAEGNTDAAVKYRRQINRTTLLVSRLCCDEGKRGTIAVHPIPKWHLRVRRVHKVLQKLPHIPKGTVRP
jgi:hypothetical protein